MDKETDNDIPDCRNAYRCEKKSTGPLDHHGLISYIKQESLASPDKEEEVPFEAGVKRGKVFVATLTKEEEAELKKKEEIAEKVKLEADEEDALAGATLTDVMALADILNTNPQNFIMDAYSDPMQYYEPDLPNETSPEVGLLLTLPDLVNINKNNFLRMSWKDCPLMTQT